jgi:hypothetical protein
MTETGAPPHEAEEEHPSSSAPCVEDDDKRPAKRQARGGGVGDVVDGKSKPSTTTPSIVPAATRLAAVYSVHRPDSSIFKRGGMKREAPAELAATNEKAKRKQRKQQQLQQKQQQERSRRGPATLLLRPPPSRATLGARGPCRCRRPCPFR